MGTATNWHPTAPNVLGLFIICACAVSKMTVKTGPAKTAPAGPLATAMY